MKSGELTIELQFFEILKRSEILSQKELIRKTPEFNDGNIKGGGSGKAVGKAKWMGKGWIP